MLITKSIERIAGATVEISEITRRVLHLNWIMQTKPDVEEFNRELYTIIRHGLT